MATIVALVERLKGFDTLLINAHSLAEAYQADLTVLHRTPHDDTNGDPEPRETSIVLHKSRVRVGFLLLNEWTMKPILQEVTRINPDLIVAPPPRYPSFQNRLVGCLMGAGRQVLLLADDSFDRAFKKRETLFPLLTEPV